MPAMGEVRSCRRTGEGGAHGVQRLEPRVGGGAGDARHEQRERLGQRARLLLDAAHRLGRHHAFRIEHQIHAADRHVAIHQRDGRTGQAPAPSERHPSATSCRVVGQVNGAALAAELLGARAIERRAHPAQCRECAQRGGETQRAVAAIAPRRCSRQGRPGRRGAGWWRVAKSSTVTAAAASNNIGVVKFASGTGVVAGDSVTARDGGVAPAQDEGRESAQFVHERAVGHGEETSGSADHRDHADRMLTVHQQWCRDGAHRHARHDGVVSTARRCSGRRRRRSVLRVRGRRRRVRAARARPTRRGSRRTSPRRRGRRSPPS